MTTDVAVQKKKLNIYIGFDTRNFGQQLAYEGCKRSMLRYLTAQTEWEYTITPLVLCDLEKEGLMHREFDKLASTEFTYTRFLAPHLNNFEGYALFCDSDFIWNTSPTETMQYLKDDHAVACVQHNYTPRSEFKMDGRVNSPYPRKNWSSLMLFNCSHPDVKQLTVENVNTKSPAWLHRMQWAKDDEIDSIPYQYNYLVGYYQTNDPLVVHYTDGGPWHPGYEQIQYGELWSQYMDTLELKKLKRELDEYYEEHPEVHPGDHK